MSTDASAMKAVLETAVDGLDVPIGVAPEMLLARASRVRARRRMVTVAAAALAVSLAVSMPAILDSRAIPGPAPAASPSPSKPGLPGTTTGMIASVLPPGLGRIEPTLNSGVAAVDPAKAAAELRAQQNSQTFNGYYAIHEPGDARVGLLYVSVAVPIAHVAPGAADPVGCSGGAGSQPNSTCTTAHLANGATLTSWHIREHTSSTGLWKGTFGAQNCAQIVYSDGRRITISAGAGQLGAHSPGAMLSTPPLSLQQVAALAELPLWWNPPPGVSR
jgi:hypothetical protein